ncbi:MAG: hypothetical protein EU530_09235 [Promethearchaeota archaeon]|nr:MAG: hypothetical protein EU530_09235 [Candidatus Lokiarchaeota archaeon]
MRCVKCGNEVNKEDFVCIYCNARLREEKIEKISYFRRVTDEKWVSPEKGWRRFLLVFTNPSRAFWDIVRYREKIGSWVKVLLLSAVIYGFYGLAIFIHLRTGGIVGQFYLRLLNGLSAYFMFFIFGFLYCFLVYMISIQLFSIGANFSIGLKSQLQLRYGKRKEKKEDEQKSTTMLEAEGIYPTALPSHLTAQKSKKIAIMLWGFAPMLLAYAVSTILLFVFLPVEDVSSPITVADFADITNSLVWGVTDWIQVIVLIGWVPITMTIAIRELVNASTFRVYLSCLIVAILLGFLLYFFRPSFLFNTAGV